MKFEFFRDVLPLPEGIVQAGIESPNEPEWFEHVPFAVPEGCEERRRDYALSRLCIREAIGATTWPEDFCGSITHSKGRWAWSAMGPKTRYRAIGVDTESLTRAWDDIETEKAIQRKFMTDDELQRLRESGLDWRVIFSAKESLFKCFSSGFGILPAFKEFRWISQNERALHFEFAGTWRKVFYRIQGSWVHTATVVAVESLR